MSISLLGERKINDMKGLKNLKVCMCQWQLAVGLHHYQKRLRLRYLLQKTTIVEDVSVRLCTDASRPLFFYILFCLASKNRPSFADYKTVYIRTSREFCPNKNCSTLLNCRHDS